jgi:predicted Zn-dependent peptidase
MSKIKFYTSVFALSMLSLFEQGCKPPQKGGNGNTMTTKYKYETVAGDALGAKMYTLKNGLKVYMSVNKDAPRIQTFIATRAGSKNDPSDATGLAHYLEHMLFKGTSKIGSINWEKEKVILKEISDLYEAHRRAKPEERGAIYAKIDSLSSVAAQFVSANEYDRMISSLGAEGTNAYTWVDQTVYVNDIPATELDKWLKVESERFQELVLRLFHTELEAVYEEFNISQNRDSRKVSAVFMNSLLPNHPYGTQTTIGTGEHLKTPSMEKIHQYFKSYYVPNNMAIVLAGDFDPDKAVELIEKYFGGYQSAEVPKFEVKPQPEITAPIVKEVLGKEKALVDIGWRLPGNGSDEALMAEVVSHVLSNGKAGLMDIELSQKQKVGPGTGSFAWGAKDFSFFGLYGLPREGQKLEEVRDLMMAQLERFKKGDFPDWLIEAAINDLEYYDIKNKETNSGRADEMLGSFINDIPWEKSIKTYERMRKFTKQQLVDFANKYFKPTNYVIIYKREGEDKDVYNVDKPKITPINLNRDAASDFKKEFDKMPSRRATPTFIDFKTTIQSEKLSSGVTVDYIKNPDNATFDLNYVLPMGSESDPMLPIMTRYLKFLGTDKYTPEQLQEEFFKLGVSFGVYSAGDITYVSLSGLDRSFEKGVELFEHILANVKPDADALKMLVADVKKEKVDAKKNKDNVLRTAMSSYGRFGHNSPFKMRLTDAQLDALKAEDLVAEIKKLTSYEHTIFYYGSHDKAKVVSTFNKLHKTPAKLTACKPARTFTEQPTTENRVVFVDFPGVTQAEILMMSKGTEKFDLDEMVMSSFYNEYFGSGLSSIVFQEIREARALAYSAYAVNRAPAYQNQAHYYNAYVGTQIDKLAQAVPAMFEIINNLPVGEEQLGNALDASLKQLESDRITKSSIYWTFLSNKKRGIDFDVRKNMYDGLKKYNGNVAAIKADLLKFHAAKIKDRKYTILVLSDKKRIDLNYLKTLGKFEELTLEEVFGY